MNSNFFRATIARTGHTNKHGRIATRMESPVGGLDNNKQLKVLFCYFRCPTGYAGSRCERQQEELALFLERVKSM